MTFVSDLLTAVISLQMLGLPMAMATTPVSVTSDERMTTSASHAQQCVVDICGPKQPGLFGRLSTDQRNWVRSPETQRWFRQNVDPKIHELISRAWRLEHLQNHGLLPLLNRLDTAHLSPTENAALVLSALNFMLNELSHSDLSAMVRSSAGGTFEIDEQQFRRLFHDLNVATQDLMIASVRAIFLSPNLAIVMQIGRSLSPREFFYYTQLLPTVGSELRSVALFLNAQIPALADALGHQSVAEVDRAIVRRAAGGENLNGADFSAFIGAFVNIFKVQENLRQIQIALQNHAPLTGNDIATILHVDRRHETDAALSDLQRLQLTRSAYRRLRLKIENVLTAAPSADETAEALRLIERVKLAAMDEISIQGVVSPSLNAAARAIVAQSQFLAPANRTTTMLAVNQRLTAALSRATEEQQNVESSIHNGAHWVLSLGGMISDRNVQSHLTFIRATERGFELDGLVDRSYGNGMIRLSWSSVKMPQFGAGIVAHELGHVVSGILTPGFDEQTQNLAQIAINGTVPIRQCTSQQHAFTNTFDSARPFATSEEDWADVFSTAVVRRLNNSQIRLQNMACLLIDQSSRPSLSLINADSHDPHSSDFYRLLQTQIGLSQHALPASCQTATRPFANTSFMRSCLR